MEFRFRADDGGPHRPFSQLSRSGDRHFTPRALPGPLHGGPPPPPPPQIEWEVASRRERIIREEVERRLIEEEVCRELAIARVRLHGGLGPKPFFRPDGPFVPPPPGPFMGVDAHFMPPPRPPLMPACMHPSEPAPASFRPLQGPGLRGCSGFGQSKLLGEARRRMPLPLSKRKHKLVQLKVEPSESFEVLSSRTKVSSMKSKVDGITVTTEPTPSSESNISRVKRKATKVSSVKSKVDGIAVTTEPAPSSEVNISGVKRKSDVIAAATEPSKSQKAARDWSCALCQVCATSEASLNTHLEGKRHKAKLAQCGVIKVIGDYENGCQETTEIKDSGCPTDAPRKICIVVDGAMHEVIQKSNHLWCEHCRVRCENNMTMAEHLRGKKHSGLNKVWKSIKAVRLNKNKEGSAATCEQNVNENGPIIISDEGKKEGVFMSRELNKNGPDEIHVEMKKETTDMDEVDGNSLSECFVGIKKEDTDIASEVNKNGHIETPMETENENNNMATEVNEKEGHVEVHMNFKQEGTDMVMDVNSNAFTEIPAKDMKQGTDVALERSEKCFSEIPIETSKETTEMLM